MLKNDKWILAQAQAGMITPFEPELVREIDANGCPRLFSHPVPRGQYRKVLSYGLSSFGYDLRLSPKDFRVFRHIPGAVIDPKNFNPQHLEPAPLLSDDNGEYFIVPGHSYGLGVAVERLEIPDNITVICMGKSSYARVGLIPCITPGEAGWRGHLTLEFSNSSPADCRIYANEGIVQLLFLEGDSPMVSYEDRRGKYQDQGEEVTFAKV